MPIWRPVLVVVLSAILASFTDWFFMGVLFHDRYDIHPEVWREGRKERSKILWSQVIGVSCLRGDRRPVPARHARWCATT